MVTREKKSDHALKHLRWIVWGMAVLTLGTACAKKNGLIGFGTAAKGGTSAAPGWKGVTVPSWKVADYTVTIEKVDISQNGDDWIPVLTESRTVKVQGGLTQIAAVGVEVPSREYQGVRVWFGKTLTAHASGGQAAGLPDTVTDFDQGNPRIYSTRNGGLSFPFILEPKAESDVIFDFDFSKSFTIGGSTETAIVVGITSTTAAGLDPRPEYRPVVTVRVTKFQG